MRFPRMRREKRSRCLPLFWRHLASVEGVSTPENSGKPDGPVCESPPWRHRTVATILVTILLSYRGDASPHGHIRGGFRTVVALYPRMNRQGEHSLGIAIIGALTGRRPTLWKSCTRSSSRAPRCWGVSPSGSGCTAAVPLPSRPLRSRHTAAGSTATATTASHLRQRGHSYNPPNTRSNRTKVRKVS